MTLHCLLFRFLSLHQLWRWVWELWLQLTWSVHNTVNTPQERWQPGSKEHDDVWMTLTCLRGGLGACLKVSADAAL
eukprot:m.204355 g.204355  ORF g.204355 m.204355 type:complete len:76 (+) comp22491_c0_seq1:629-856(+)